QCRVVRGYSRELRGDGRGEETVSRIGDESEATAGAGSPDDTALPLGATSVSYVYELGELGALEPLPRDGDRSGANIDP
ncbi:MAG: hypothetical protein BRD39_02655, partial [Bacteroidetes bacterium QH_9_64_21]